MSRSGDVPPDEERVVLLDHAGRPSGTAPKRSVHTTTTPLHLGFSCHLIDREGRVLLTRRAPSKPTWPGVWTNACCGHPQPGETLRGAVTRRLGDELGVGAEQIGLAIADFTYRSVMPNGVVEHEVCPVIVGRVRGELELNPDEVCEATWVDWGALCDRARRSPESLSPWSVGQIAELRALAPSPHGWPRRFDDAGLDTPIETPAVSGPLAPSWREDPLVPVHGPVQRIIDDYVAERTAELVALDPSLATVAREISSLIAAGGKRLRPGCVYWGHRATGAEHEAGVFHVAAAVEMLHTFALLHDDVMDRAARRRGRPTATQAFLGVHRDEDLDGDACWFATSAAILAGDLAFVWADDLLDRAPLAREVIARARRVFTALRVEVTAGQYLDLRLDRLAAADPSAARRVALLKSGRYTITRPLMLGQTLAGEDDAETSRALFAYGDALGLAFQMRDDILGLIGEPALTGKSHTSDLRDGKRTVLILRALALATPVQRVTLEQALGNAELDDAAAGRCREIVATNGALASVETLIRAQHGAAVAAIAGLPEPARGALGDLAATVVDRAR